MVWSPNPIPYTKCPYQVPPPQVMTMVDESKTRHKDLYNVVHPHPNSLYPSYHPKHSSTAAPAIFNLKYEWKTGRWGNCSTCGSDGKRQRSVLCSKTTGTHDFRYVDDYFCDSKMRPVNITSCADVSCNIWNFNQWTECSDNCEMTRRVICQNEQEQLSDSQCDPSKRPPERKTCCHIKWRSIRTAVRDKTVTAKNQIPNIIPHLAVLWILWVW